jgi:hypothetical protein
MSLKDAGGAASTPCSDLFATEGIKLPADVPAAPATNETVIIQYKDHRMLEK